MDNELIKTAYAELEKLKKERPSWEVYTRINALRGSILYLQEYIGANKINELIRDVDKELKCLEREFLTISSTGFDMLFIASRQDELHKFYEEQEKAIGVEFN